MTNELDELEEPEEYHDEEAERLRRYESYMDDLSHQEIDARTMPEGMF